MQPLIPIPPSELIPFVQIIRPNVPWQQAPGGKSGLGDINVEHIFVPEHHDWGTLGFGYTATVPTADHRHLGTGKYQAGQIQLQHLGRSLMGFQGQRWRTQPQTGRQVRLRLVAARISCYL